jgi:hypothetical protein
MPIALVGLTIKLALINGTPVFPFACFFALRFLSVPLAIWIVLANKLIDFGGAWNDEFAVFGNASLLVMVALASNSEARAGEQNDKGGRGGEVFHRITSPKHSTLVSARSWHVDPL